MVTIIADTLHSGTQTDGHAFQPDLLPRAQTIIDVLLQREPPHPTAAEDAMFQAINTSKGRVIEALFSHALRAARVSDSAEGNHVNRWKGLQPIFERELTGCKDTNFEFSTLCGAYLSQLQYLDQSWTNAHVDQIFPADYESNMICAVDGLAYSAFTQPLYEVLAKHGILDRALLVTLKGKGARPKLLERIAGAYLWGIETLTGHRFEQIFKQATVADIEAIAWVFWTVRGPDVLTSDQHERIVAFWEKATVWVNEQPQVPERLLSQLGLLATHVMKIADRESALLQAVAPYVGTGHNQFEFVEQLLRLAPENHAEVTVVLEKMLSSHVPDYDYEDRLRKLLELLADKGHRESVMLQAERLRHLPSIQELYKKLTTP